MLTTRYQQLLANAKAGQPNPYFLDIGCGRGEMLDLAASVGYQTLGVDSSGSMLGERGRHHIYQADALDYLLRQDGDSLRAISCLHVVEHNEPLYVFKLIGEAGRVLSKGGGLLLETPSLFSLWASARQFFLDPTHRNPYHPDLLRLMLEEAGFTKIQVLEFAPVQSQEKPKFEALFGEPNQAEWQKLEKWLYGPMDMAIWAEK
ncbi:MAG: class I SAM-dependent methyltransferase [Oligoflexales bacterium]